MRAISTRKHKALMIALEQLAEASTEQGQETVSTEIISEGFHSLQEAHERYTGLIADLEESIAAYETTLFYFIGQLKGDRHQGSWSKFVI